jgi:serine O-acetyltransferase
MEMIELVQIVEFILTQISAPQIGCNVYLVSGVIIFGDISIPNNTLISANSTVNKSFVDENTMLAGSPAKVIKSIDVRTIFKHLGE